MGKLDLPLLDYMELSDAKKHHLKGYKTGVEFSKKEVPFDPYVVGLWLGDGTSRDTTFTNQDAPILHYLSKTLPNYNMYLQHEMHTPYGYRMNAINDKKSSKSGNGQAVNPLKLILKNLNMLNNKHIPFIYKINDRETRLKLLAGILDTDGCYSKNHYEITQKSNELADDIVFLARSLGFAVSLIKYESTLNNKKFIQNRIRISGDKLFEIPVLCKRKKAEEIKHKCNVLHTGITVEPLGEGDYYGFEIDGNHRYLLGDFTVTHNTSVAKALSKCLGLPFEQVSFGGVNSSDFLLGHDYTYLSSRQGEISRCLTRMGSKNGILFFDEFDKVSDKKDILSSLLHITDFSQNYEFRDSYFPELTQDLSKCWFIYSMNHLPDDPALVDRLEVIKVDGYSIEDRKVMTKDYLIPKFIEEFKISEEIKFTDAAIDKIVLLSGDGQRGVRDLERYISLIVEKTYFFVCNQKGQYDFKWYKKMSEDAIVGGKVIISDDLVDLIFKENKPDPVYYSMYM
jgi:hypothetical protein